MNDNSSNVYRTNNFSSYDEAFEYKQFKKTDGIQSSLYDINLAGNVKNFTKNQAVLVIDSVDRNHNKFPNPNKYTIKLNKVYKDVTRIELKLALIPNSAFIVNESNNKLHFQDNMEQVSKGELNIIEIPIGNWPADSTTGPSIRSNLEDALNANNPNNEYAVIFDPHVMKFTIEQVKGSGIFNLIFNGGTEKFGTQGTITRMEAGVDRFLDKEIPVGESRNIYPPQSLGPLLGFDRVNLVGQTSYTGNMAANLNPDRYIILRIRNWERVESNDEKRDGAFCIIGMENSANNFIFNRNCDLINNETYTKFYNPPEPEINEVDIEILNSRGEPFEFNGHNHLLVFDVLSLTRFDNY